MFSRERKYAIIITFIFILFNTGVVIGQTQTPDPTPTQNPGYQPTIFPRLTQVAENYGCVYNPPIYYQTKTPSPLWMMKCAHCLPENNPIITPTPFMTPTPIGGGSFPASEYDDDTNVWMIDGYNDWVDVNTLAVVNNLTPGQNVQNHDDTLGYNYFVDTGFNLNGPNGSTYTNYFTYNYDIIKTSCPSLYCSYDVYFRWKFRCYSEECNINLYEADTGTFIEGWELTNSQASGRYIAGPTSLCTAIDEDEDIIVEINIVNPTNDGSADFQMHDSENQFICGSYTRYEVLNWVQSPFSTSPEINYPCGVITGEGEEAEDMYGFDYSGIEFGDSYCADIGPYSWEILGFTVDLPYVAHLCSQEINFGDVTIFGVDLSLDAFAIVLAVAWVIRNLFIS